ncbi:MAG TPA: phosphoenolpyruvate carboxykinase (GTP) [Armatimonadota bacterium]
MTTENATSSVERWVQEIQGITQPDQVVWLHGGAEEYSRLMEQALKDGVFQKLNEETFPNCYLHRSHANDVARAEHLTFICSRTEDQAGPTNNWWDPKEAREKVGGLFKGCMKGRTLYVIPYLMGVEGSSFSQVGVELSDSIYVAISMTIMTRVGDVALKHLETTGTFVKGLHSTGELDPERRYILHFPEDREIWSFGSGYGGNALLGKKCHSLRIASAQARDEGWMAEHMLILGLQRPGAEEITYIAAAFPSACGKTNLAMMKSPLEKLGYKVWTVGDDIAWLRIGEDGRLWAVNPEAGTFGVAPGTSFESNPNAMAMTNHDSLHTNVAVSPSGEPWWEGIGHDAPEGLIDWHGNVWDGKAPAAHPNSRFTCPIATCPSLSPEYNNPQGVPISAILFGGRRAKLAPLVYQTYGWDHGVFVGASMGSEMTAAAAGQVGATRRDPMAMLPFCGYHVGDYLSHWIEVGKRASSPPLVFNVNWFRKGDDGKFLWPGYGDNVRVLKWIAERVEGTADAEETPIGYVPKADALYLDGLNLDPETLKQLLSVNSDAWKAELEGIDTFFAKIGDRLPKALLEEREKLAKRLG